MDQLKKKGNQAYQQADYLTAVELYSKAIRKYPKESSLYGNRSAAYFMLQRYNEAEQDCLKCLQADQKNEKVKYRLGKIYLARAEFQQAKTIFQKIKNQEQTQLVDDLQNTVGRFEKTMNEQNYTEALVHINKLTNHCPAHQPFIFKKVQCMIKNGQCGAALSYFQEASSNHQNNIELIYWRGVIYYFMNEHQKAAKYFKEILSQDPEHQQSMQIVKKIKQLDAVKEQGNNLFKAKNFKEAILVYTQAIEIDPEHKIFNSLILNNRAACYIGLENYNKALSDCNSAIQLNPSNAKAYLRRGNIKIKLEDGDPNEAIQDYEKARELDPSIDIRSNLNEARMAQKNRKRKDYYKILGITQKATEEEIRKAYKRKAIEWHPDKHSNEGEEQKKHAEKMFKDIGEAYSVLSDPQKRQRYDMGADLEDVQHGFSEGMHIDPNEIFAQFFGGNNPFGGAGFGSGGANVFFSSQGSPFGDMGNFTSQEMPFGNMGGFQSQGGEPNIFQFLFGGGPQKRRK